MGTKDNVLQGTVRGLLVRLFTVVMGVIIALAAILTILSVIGQTRFASQALDKLGFASVKALAELTELPLQFDDQDTLNSLVPQIRGLNDESLYAAILNERLQLVVADPPSYQPGIGTRGMVAPGTLEAESLVVTDLPVRHFVYRPSKGGASGFLFVLGMNATETEQATARARDLSILISLVFVILGAAVVAFVSRRIMQQADKAAGRMRETDSLMLRIAQDLKASAEEILAVAKNTESNSAEESSAVQQTRHTMQSLLVASNEIADGARMVEESAERSAAASTQIADRISRLHSQALKITDIAERIRGIADKSDILALNASLEGAKAGETGRGFVLVGEEMRRLAETVSDAVRDIRALADDIRQLSQSTVLAAEEGEKLANQTTDVSKRITGITGQQRTDTEQVTQAMDEINEFTQHALAAARESRDTAGDLARAAQELSALLGGGDAEAAQPSA